MSWSRTRTEASVWVEVGLDEFDTAALLQELLDRRIINQDEASRLLGRQKADGTPLRFPVAFPDEVSAATEELIRGRTGEAKILLERALGWEWSGVLS